MEKKCIAQEKGYRTCFKLCVLFFFLNFTGLNAQTLSEGQRTITGKVMDATGETLPGVTVLIKGSNTATMVDISGGYSIAVPDDNAVLRFSMVGYTTQEIPVKGKPTIDITLEEDAKALSEVVVVGYGTQKKVTLAGSVVQVEAKEIKTATSSNIENLLAGKLPGVRIQQRTGEPGDYSTKMDIRGFGSPLFVIDGIVSPEADFKRLNTNDIETVSALKDASAAIYGIRAIAGVILVTTKRGKGKTTVEYTGTFGFQNPSGLPDVLNSAQYAELVREADKNMGRGIDATFTAQDLENFRNGLTPTTDWADLAMRKTAPQTQQNLSVSGGNEKSDYFLTFDYYEEDGIWKSGDLNYERFNLRTNIGVNITKHLRGEVLVNAMLDEKNQPYRDTWEQFKSIWMLKPNYYPYANNNPDFLQDVLYGLNPLASTDSDVSGYKTFQHKNFNAITSLKYDAPFLPGLSAKLVFGYTYNNQTSKQFQKQYTLYNYDDKTESYTPFNYNNPSSISRSYWERTQTLSQFHLNYENSFAEKHNVKGLLAFEGQDNQYDNFWVRKEMELDAIDQLFAGSSNNMDGNANTANWDDLRHQRNLGVIGRLNYDYLSKYIIELSFRYDGSSLYADGDRWGFFPAAFVAYRISEEDFFKKQDFLSFVSNLKLRASYGGTGDERTAGYQYLEGFNYPGPSYAFGDVTYKGLSARGIPNPDLTWMKSKLLNIGADLDLWNGLLTAQLDVFQRNVEGQPGNRGATVPSTFGSPLPDENLISYLNKGFEIVLSHFNKINDFDYSVSMNFALTRYMWKDRNETDATSSWDRWKNKYNNRYGDMGWTYGSNGQFTSMQDIWNSAIQDGQGGATQLPGDWKYEDWNQDGVIDGNDMYPNSFEHTDDKGNPKMTFGSTITMGYKGFDLNVLFQGGAGFNVIYFEQLQYPLCFGGNGLAHFYDRYHQDDQGNWIAGKWPTTRDAGSFGVNYARAQQTTYDASYLRLKSVELGYSLPAKLAGKVQMKRIRVFANGFNLYTWSDLNFVDPEHPEGNYGYLYPIMRNFNFGVNITF